MMLTVAKGMPCVICSVSPPKLNTAIRNDITTTPIGLCPASQLIKKADIAVGGGKARAQAAFDRHHLAHARQPGQPTADKHHEQRVARDRQAIAAAASGLPPIARMS